MGRATRILSILFILSINSINAIAHLVVCVGVNVMLTIIVESVGEVSIFIQSNIYDILLKQFIEITGDDK